MALMTGIRSMQDVHARRKQFMALVAGQQVGAYRILEPLAQGGMAAIYKAEHTRLGRIVALKVLHPTFLDDPGFLARFEREARIVAQLEHPHIVPVYDFSEFEGQPYLVMKYIEGRTLKSLMDERRLSQNEIIRILEPLAEALDYAHQQGVLHRDIKPSNIILDEAGTPYLTDFGLARMAQLGASTLSADVLLGTPYYLSPEQASGKADLDARTDVYSLGVVLYEMLTGRVPFKGDTPYSIIHDHIYTPLPPPSSINPEISPAVEAVLQKMLAKNPAARYASASEAIRAFRDAAAGRAPQPTADYDPFAAEMSTPRAPEPPPRSEPPEIPEMPRRRVLEASFDLSEAGQAFAQAGEKIREVIDEMVNHDDELMTLRDTDEALRERVRKQIEKRNEFIGHAIAYTLVNLLLWVIFGSDFFASAAAGNFELPWPIFVTLGWGAGLAAHAVDTFYQTGRRATRLTAAVRNAFVDAYGENWARTAPKSELKKIRKRVEAPFKKRQEFFSHLAVYLMINLMLWIIGGNSSFPWPLIVSFGWGIGLVSHAFDALSLNNRERAIQKAVERERAMLYGEKPKRDFDFDDKPKRGGIRLTEDGELTDSMLAEIEDELNREDSRRHR